MKQVALDLRNGVVSLLDCPDPVVGKNELLVAGSCSLVSPGTERMLLDFGSGGWLAKARQQPEKLKQTFRKIKTDGLAATVKAVQSKLSQAMPLGYSHVGRVVAAGSGVAGFKSGDRVVSNGHHASVVAVPANLCAKIPKEVSDAAAAFTVPAAIALQSIRLLQPTFGETVVVIGAGLIGQLTARLLLANGCRVFVTDKRADRLALLPTGVTAQAGLEKLTDAYANVDGVLITAATSDRDLANQCAAICRRRGRIILSGVAPIHLDRSLLYEKEISFQVSCSYGPGRYDPKYEREGVDYPFGFVRWTAQRNFEAVLEAMRLGQLEVDSLISRKAPIAEAQSVYRQLQEPGSKLLTALFTYADEVVTIEPGPSFPPSKLLQTAGKIGIAGSGQYTAGVLLPLLQELKAPVKAIAGKNGFQAAALAKKYNLSHALSGLKPLLADPEIGLVIIATPHQYHAEMAVQAMHSGKDVFLEKPMAIDRQGLQDIIAVKEQTGSLLYVGYNRRFSPLLQQAKIRIKATSGPLFINYAVNAGRLPEKHWLQDEALTGGRLIGEVCHFIDCCVFLQGAPVTTVFARQDADQNTSILLSFSNGATSVINYFSSGSPSYPKERLEMHYSGRSMVIDNWRRIQGYGVATTPRLFPVQDKGHKAGLKQLLASWPQRKELIPFHELINVASATLAVPESLKQGSTVFVG